MTDSQNTTASQAQTPGAGAGLQSQSPSQSQSSSYEQTADRALEEPLFFDPHLRKKPKKHGRAGAVVAPAGLEAPVADTHAHLPMLPDAGLALARAAAHGVDFVECMLDPAEDYLGALDDLPAWSTRATDLLQKWGLRGEGEGGDCPTFPIRNACVPVVRFAVGVHPHNAKDYTPALEAQMLAALNNPLVSAVGEIGLDYHYDLSPRKTQQEVFARQVGLAARAGLPAILHVREAFDDAYDIMQREGWPAAGVLLHCYTSDAHEVARWVAAGCYIAFGGAFTFKKLADVRAAAALVPRERLLTETDAPFMAPEPFRGTTCEPAHTPYTAAAMYEFLSAPASAEGRTCSGVEGGEGGEGGAGGAAATAAPASAPPFANASRAEFLAQLHQNALDLLNRPRAANG